jgi:hypothetical protein
MDELRKILSKLFNVLRLAVDFFVVVNIGDDEGISHTFVGFTN